MHPASPPLYSSFCVEVAFQYRPQHNIIYQSSLESPPLKAAESNNMYDIERGFVCLETQWIFTYRGQETCCPYIRFFKPLKPSENLISSPLHLVADIRIARY